MGLSEAVTDLASFAKSGKNNSRGKVGANVRSVIGEIEMLRPYIEAGGDTKADEELRAEEKVDYTISLRATAKACEIEKRLDALIENKMRRLVAVRESQRMYCKDSSVKLIEHGAATAKDVSSNSTVIKAARLARLKKSKSANDNWNDDNNNNNDNKYGNDKG